MSKVLVVGNVVTQSTGKSMPAPVVLGVDQSKAATAGICITKAMNRPLAAL